ncbi:MAG: hypothetical protein ACI4KE_06600, partial [Anaerovoracaceae bacterium]
KMVHDKKSVLCLDKVYHYSELVLKEHEAAKWLSREELDLVDWLPADITIIEQIRSAMAG